MKTMIDAAADERGAQAPQDGKIINARLLSGAAATGPSPNPKRRANRKILPLAGGWRQLSFFCDEAAPAREEESFCMLPPEQARRRTGGDANG